MKNISISLAAMIVMILSTGFLHAQTNPSADSIYYIILKDGTTINGTLKEKTEKEVRLNSKNFGVVTIPIDSIRKLDVLAPSAYKNGKFWFPNPNATRYVVSPSAIPLKKGEGYFQNTYLFLCSVNYGITNHVSVGAVFDVITPFVKDAGGPIALASVKVAGEVTKNLFLSSTTIALHIPALSDATDKNESLFLIENGGITLGNQDNNATAGIGYGLQDGKFMPAPAFTISGMARVTPRFSFITENWFFQNTTVNYVDGINDSTTKYYALLSYGMRFMSQKIAVDFGFINSKDISQGIFIGIPYVDFVVKF